MANESEDTMHTHRPCMLSTIDNPFNPFTHWNEWLKYDRDQGYYTNEYLARVANTEDTLSDEENSAALRQAMRDIVEYNPTYLYMLVFEPNIE